jgi:hypothetical protein
MAKKRKYWVDIPEARNLLFKGYSMKSKEQQFYELWIIPVGYQAVFHWYHTQGTLVMKYKKKGVITHKSIEGVYGDAESCALAIQKEIKVRPNLQKTKNYYFLWKKGLEDLYKVIHNS